jgi:hypothetical protein
MIKRFKEYLSSPRLGRAMISRFEIVLCVVFLVAVTVGAGSLPAVAGGPVRDVASTQSVSTLSEGIWSGTFQSKHPEVAPFSMTVDISHDPSGNLTAATNSAADCFSDTTLQVSVKGTNAVLAGSDADGNSITFRGSLDNSGTILNLHYILNGANGRCESDDGNGTLSKR